MAGLDLRATLAMDGSGFEAGLNRVGSTLKSRLATIFSVAAITSFGKQILDNVSHIKDMAQQMNVTTTEMQQLDFAAKKNSLSFEDVGTALIRLGKARRDAAESNDDLVKVFAKFGVTLADINNPAMRNVDILNQMSSAIETMNLTARERTELNDLLGRVGEKLEVVLRDAKELSGVNFISDEQIARLDKMDKILERASKNLKNFATESLGTMVEKLENLGKIAGGFMIGKAAGLDNFWSARLSRILVGADNALEAEKQISGQPPTAKGSLFDDKRKLKEVTQVARAIPPGDSLVRVGNFLGSSRDVISKIGERTNELLTKIEMNTRARATVTASSSEDIME